MWTTLSSFEALIDVVTTEAMKSLFTTTMKRSRVVDTFSAQASCYRRAYSIFLVISTEILLGISKLESFQTRLSICTHQHQHMCDHFRKSLLYMYTHTHRCYFHSQHQSDNYEPLACIRLYLYSFSQQI